MSYGYQTGKWKTFLKLTVSYLIELFEVQQGSDIFSVI